MTSPGAQPQAANRAAIAVVGVVCGALSAAMVVITLESSIVDHPVYYAALRAVFMFGLLAIGLYGWNRDSGGQFPALVLVLWFPATGSALTGVDDPWLFTLGRICVAVNIVLFVVLFLSYPTGRITDAPGRRLAIGAAVATGVFLTLTLLFSPEPPVAGPLTRRADDCPETPLAIVDATTAIGRFVPSPIVTIVPSTRHWSSSPTTIRLPCSEASSCSSLYWAWLVSWYSSTRTWRKVRRQRSRTSSKSSITLTVRTRRSSKSIAFMRWSSRS